MCHLPEKGEWHFNYATHCATFLLIVALYFQNKVVTLWGQSLTMSECGIAMH
jgi:hypothetical protein